MGLLVYAVPLIGDGTFCTKILNSENESCSCNERFLRFDELACFILAYPFPCSSHILPGSAGGG